MIEVSNLNDQTIQPGQSVTFDTILLRTAYGAERFNLQTPTFIKLCANGIYLLAFSGNIAATADNTLIQLAMSIGSSPLTGTLMIATPATAGNYNNISTTKLFYNEGCCGGADQISITNTGSNPVILRAGSGFAALRKS